MTAYLTEKRDELSGRREKLLSDFAETARVANDPQLDTILKDIRLTNEFIESLDRISAEQPQPASTVPRFTVSSMFLADAYKKLTADQDEQFVFITGAEVDGNLVLDQMIELEHDKRNYVGVTAAPRSTHKLLIKLEQFGHRLLGHFHSHPGLGEEATKPSGIDTGFQQRLENAGHKAVMAVFSRDGFVRFVRMDQKFEIQIFGEGVEKHAQNIYRLTHVD